MDTLFGGGGSTQSSSTSSGFSQLPSEIQDAWKNLASQSTNTLGSPQSAASMFTLPSLGAGAQNAISQINQGFTPTASSLSSDIAMQTNPYDQSVIDTINREAAGQGSQLDSYLTKAGQFGSNRGALSANDIDLTRLQQIGQFKQGEFQNALNNAMTTLPGLRMASAQGALNTGLMQQQQEQQNKLAPVSALQALAQSLGVTGSLNSSQTVSSGNSQQQNGIFSDIRLKENIEYIGMENGHRKYRFNYAVDGEKTKFTGVLAQEIMGTMPEAVSFDGRYYKVDYSKIGIEHRRV